MARMNSNRNIHGWAHCQHTRDYQTGSILTTVERDEKTHSIWSYGRHYWLGTTAWILDRNGNPQRVAFVRYSADYSNTTRGHLASVNSAIRGAGFVVPILAPMGRADATRIPSIMRWRDHDGWETIVNDWHRYSNGQLAGHRALILASRNRTELVARIERMEKEATEARKVWLSLNAFASLYTDCQIPTPDPFASEGLKFTWKELCRALPVLDRYFKETKTARRGGFTVQQGIPESMASVRKWIYDPSFAAGVRKRQRAERQREQLRAHYQREIDERIGTQTRTVHEWWKGKGGPKLRAADIARSPLPADAPKWAYDYGSYSDSMPMGTFFRPAGSPDSYRIELDSGITLCRAMVLAMFAAIEEGRVLHGGTVNVPTDAMRAARVSWTPIRLECGVLYIGCHRFPLSTVAAMALHLGMADEAPVQYFWNYNPENLLERGKLYLEWVNTPSATAPAEAPPAEAPPVEVPPCG